jgi:hypothetical protein
LQIVREKKADQSNDQVDPSTTTEHPDQPSVDGAADATDANRSRGKTLAAPGVSRTRSHSRHSAVTDKGQANTSGDDLSSIPPPHTDATNIASDRQASPLPSPTGDTFSPPGIVVSDNPRSPATLIPATDGSSTRPTKGGIAYPFSLKVDEPGAKGSNASMITLDSVGITTPPAVDVQQSEKELGHMNTMVEPANETAVTPGAERPEVERFYTSGTGAGLFNDGVPAERPGVERFETAREDLSTLASKA